MMMQKKISLLLLIAPLLLGFFTTYHPEDKSRVDWVFLMLSNASLAFVCGGISLGSLMWLGKMIPAGNLKNKTLFRIIRISPEGKTVKLKTYSSRRIPSTTRHVHFGDAMEFEKIKTQWENSPDEVLLIRRQNELGLWRWHFAKLLTPVNAPELLKGRATISAKGDREVFIDRSSNDQYFTWLVHDETKEKAGETVVQPPDPGSDFARTMSEVLPPTSA